MISAEAIEAAGKAMHADAYPADYWDTRPDLRHIFTKRAAIALEAAAPYMLAGAWAEGYNRGRSGDWPDDNPRDGGKL